MKCDIPGLNCTKETDGIFTSLYHGSSTYNEHTSWCYDFCMVDQGDGTPIFCVLGFRPVCETSSSKTSLSAKRNSFWASTYVNWGKNGEVSDMVLILSSFLENKSIAINNAYTAEDPQNVIYTTGKTSFQESCSVDCGCYSSSYVDYGEKQLFKNTHKCVIYKAASGTQYLIYCYCSPGKTKQLYLGYARIYVKDNKVHLLTKCEFRASEEPWSDSFGDFRYCTRIVSLDCKNGHVWITWGDDGCCSVTLCRYNYFHILAKDLVGE